MEKRIVNVGIVGFGGVGEHITKYILKQTDIKIKAIAEQDETKRKRAEEIYGLKTYADHRKLCEDKDIEVIYNATPNFMHSEVAIAGLKSGKHVFSEKPFAMTKEEIAAMLKAEKESGRYLQIDFEMRYSLLCKRVKELIDAGEIGEPKNILFNHFCGGQGFEKEKTWRAKIENIGGYYIEEGCHRLDIFRYYMGEEMEEVMAIPAPQPRGPEGWHRAYREPACTLCFFPGEKLANLITIQHRAVYFAPPGMENELGHEYNVSVVGSEGSLYANFWKSKILLMDFSGPGGKTCLKRVESYPVEDPNVLHHDSRGFFRDFVYRIRDGKPPFFSAFDSWKTMACVFACEESFKKGGERVKVDYTLPQV
ncbi:MAG TPA: Gfo/Idh/MocA family oxidoreductase [bacterium]|nr:Gfo/Idh/MocA family oxidoreductase [bacterium]HPP29968.1 Gfo/Idh/MocA family oxidoreductase [bacterium]